MRLPAHQKIAVASPLCWSIMTTSAFCSRSSPKGTSTSVRGPGGGRFCGARIREGEARARAQAWPRACPLSSQELARSLTGPKFSVASGVGSRTSGPFCGAAGQCLAQVCAVPFKEDLGGQGSAVVRREVTVAA